MPEGMTGGPLARAIRQMFSIAGLCVALTGPAQAQDFRAGCVTAPEAPPFISRTVNELGLLQSHSDRWRDPLPWQQLLRELDRLRFDGLYPQNYLLSDLARITDQRGAGIPPTSCQSELASLALVWSLADLSRGRLNPEELGLIWHQDRIPRDPRQFALDIHQDMQHRRGIQQAYQNARPAVPGYLALRASYRHMHRALPESWPQVPVGPTLRAGDQGPRVSALANRLAAQEYLTLPVPLVAEHSDQLPERSELIFGDRLERAVKRFQRDHGLTADGLAGRDTLANLNVAPGAWLARIRANLERMRWIAPYHADDMVLVDIAGARVWLFRDGREVWRGNTQVGRPERKTPALTSAISHVTLNPTWTIPPTVFYEDTLPAIQADPDYLYRNRLTVLDRSGTLLDPAEVDWSTPGNLLLRQAAGPGNALGEVAIRFPNPFAVYLHDTPSRWLFDTPDRFYSSGCVRVENAMELTEWLFRKAPTATRERVSELRRSGETRNVSLPQRVRLIMAYWTAEAGADGRVRFRQDTYEEDRLVIDLLDEDI